MKELTTKQACLILALSIISLKFLLFPSIISTHALRDCYFSVIFVAAVDLLFLPVVIVFIKKHPDDTFYIAMKKTLGNIIAKIILIIMFLYFFIKAYFILKELCTYLEIVIFDSINIWQIILPLILLSAYVLKKQLRALARSIELLSVLIFAGILLTALMPADAFDIYNILPFMEHGVAPVFKSILFSSFSFGDVLLLFVFLGKIKIEKNTGKKIFITYGISYMFIFIFFFVFVGVFAETAVNQSLAASDLPFSSALPNTVGKLDWLIMIMWIVNLIFGICIYLTASMHCIKDSFGIKNSDYVSYVICIALLTLSYFVTKYMDLAVKIAASLPFNITVASVQFLLPCLFLTCFVVLSIKQKQVKHV